MKGYSSKHIALKIDVTGPENILFDVTGPENILFDVTGPENTLFAGASVHHSARKFYRLGH